MIKPGLAKDKSNLPETSCPPSEKLNNIGQPQKHNEASLLQNLATGDTSLLEELRVLNNHMNDWRDEKLETARIKHIQEQWRDIATIWDRMFFWLFACLLVTINIVMFVIVPLFKVSSDLDVVDYY
jgi:hypothetical protein